VSAGNDFPRDVEIPGFAPESLPPKPWERVESIPEWRAFLQRISREKRKGELKYGSDGGQNLAEVVWGPYSLRIALLELLKAKPGNSIDVSWLAIFPDRLRIESNGRIKVLRDSVYEEILAALDGRNKDVIGQCPVCRGLFLRKRKDQLVCSNACRVRKSFRKRPDKLVEYEVRRAQRDFPKDLAKIEKLRKKRAEEGQPKHSPSPHKRSPRVLQPRRATQLSAGSRGGRNHSEQTE
jgi:hypothetical protein